MKDSNTIVTLKKAHTSLSNIVTMCEKDEYCIDIMQQSLAVIGLLRSAHESLMENHLKTCFASAMSSGNKAKKKKMVEEILKVINLYNR